MEHIDLSSARLTINKPTLAICIPVRNGKETIVRLIDSILASSVLPDEIIVSDNFSDDGTPLLLEDYFGDRVKISVNPSDIGFDINVVRSVHLSHSDYVWILGDHCVISNHSICTIKQLLEQSNYPDGAVVDFQSVHALTGDLIKSAYSCQSSTKIITSLFDYTNSVAFHGYISCFIFKRCSFMACNLDRYSDSLFIHSKCALELIRQGGILYEYPFPFVSNLSRSNFSRTGSEYFLILIKTIQLAYEFKFPIYQNCFYLNRVCTAYLHEKLLHAAGKGYIPGFYEVMAIVKSLWWHPLMWVIMILDLLLYPVYRQLKYR